MAKIFKRIQYNAPVTLTFTFLSLAALVLGLVSGGAITQALFCVYRAPLYSPLTWVRFFGHVLGHANFSHFAGNMTLFLVIAPPMEERYGSQKLLACILATALISGLVQFVFFPTTGLLGASGIVFMLVLLSSLSGGQTGRIPLTLILVAVIYLGGEIYDGLFTADSVSQMAHLVGGACGAGFGLLLRSKERQ